MFNTALKTELAETQAKLKESQEMVENLVDRVAKNEIFKMSLVELFNMERAENVKLLRREKAKARPSEKKVYALEEMGYKLAEIQNRIMDGEF